MGIIIIHTDGIWFITFSSAILASTICLCFHLGKLSTLAAKLLAQSMDAPHHRPDVSSPPEPGKAALELPGAPCDLMEDLKDSTNKETNIKRRWSFPRNASAIRKSIGIPRSKSFMWRSHATPVECPSPTSPSSISPEVPVLYNPFSQDAQDRAPAQPPVQTPSLSPLQKSAPIGIEELSAVEECSMQDPEAEQEPSNDMDTPAQVTLAGPVDSRSPAVGTTTPSPSPSQQRPRRRVKGPRPRPASMYAAIGTDGQRRYAQPARPENSLPCEVFERRYENPFKPRSRSVTLKGEKGIGFDASSKASGPSRRRSILVMISTFRRSFIKGSDGEDLRDTSVSSLRSSASSTTGTSTSSVSSKSRWSFCMRNGVPRTDPYGPPYFAQPPIPADASRRGRRA